MKQEINARLLSSIIKDLDSGRLLWGLLRANEYLSPGHPLRKALLQRIPKERLMEHPHELLLSSLLDGKRRSQLLKKSQTIPMERATSKKYFIPDLKALSTIQMHRESLDRRKGSTLQHNHNQTSASTNKFFHVNDSS